MCIGRHLFYILPSVHGNEQDKVDKTSGRFSQFRERTQKVMALPRVIMSYIIYVSPPIVCYAVRHERGTTPSN